MKYAGIGTRNMVWNGVNYRQKVKDNIIELHEYYRMGEDLLRSGGADESDAIHEEIHRSFNGKCEIFLPWKKFNGHSSTLFNISDEAIQLAYKFHPLGDRLTHPARALMARNGYQMLGYNLNDPVDYVICSTPDMTKGGTSQAIRIAKHYNIPVFNLFYEGDFEKAMDFLSKRK